MINGDYVLARATTLAEKLQKELQVPEELLSRAFQQTWGRGPSKNELSQAVKFVGGPFTSQADKINKEKLVDFCHVLLNSSEFIYLD